MGTTAARPQWGTPPRSRGSWLWAARDPLGVPVRSCLNAREGFRASLLVDRARNPGGNFSGFLLRVGISGMAEPRFSSSLLQSIILLLFFIMGGRQYQIRSAISYSTSVSQQRLQRLNYFSPLQKNNQPTNQMQNIKPQNHQSLNK